MESYCTNCGTKLNPGDAFCQECGTKVEQRTVNNQTHNQNYNQGYNQMPLEQKNPGISLLGSFFLPGLGQIINGQTKKGLTLIVLYIISWALSIIVIGLIFVVLIWIYGMYDAYNTAQKINAGEIVEDALF